MSLYISFLIFKISCWSHVILRSFPNIKPCERTLSLESNPCYYSLPCSFQGAWQIDFVIIFSVFFSNFLRREVRSPGFLGVILFLHFEEESELLHPCFGQKKKKVFKRIANDAEITLGMFLSVCSSSCQGLQWILTVSYFATFSFFYPQVSLCLD